MKKVILLALGLLSLNSCYKDLGNYNYNFEGLNEIQEIEFSHSTFQGIYGQTIEVQQPLRDDKTERIEVILKQTKETSLDNIDFRWILKYNEIVGKDTIKHKDTLHTKGYIDVVLKGAKPSQYDVQLELKDKTTQLAKYQKLRIQTRPIYKNSLFILHGSPGNTHLANIEETPTGAEVVLDAFGRLYPNQENPFKNATHLSYVTYFENRAEANRLAVFTSDGNATIYNPFGLDVKYTKSYVLPSGNVPFIAKTVQKVGDISRERSFVAAIGQDGRFLVGKKFLAYHEPSQKRVHDYNVEAMTMTESHFVAWDAKHHRFIVLLKNDGFALYPESAARAQTQLSRQIVNANVQNAPRDKTALYAYVNSRDNYEEAHPYFIFRDNQTNELYSYELTPANQSDGNSEDKDDKKDDKAEDDKKDDKDKDEKDKDGKDDKDSEDAYVDNGQPDGNPLFSLHATKLRNIDRGINPLTIVYNSWFTPNYFFYAAGNKLYRYNTSSHDNLEIYVAPEGYEISVMKFRTDDASQLLKELGLYLSIGMNKGGQGAVAEMKFTTSGDLDNDYGVKLYEQDKDGRKFGQIRELQFAHTYIIL